MNLRQNKKKLSLFQRIVSASIVPSFVSALVLVGYSLVSSQIPVSSYFNILKYMIPIVIVCQAIASTFFSKLLYAKTSDRLDEFYAGKEFSEDERYSLFLEVSKIPMRCSLITIVFFVIGSIVFSILYKIVLHLETSIVVLVLLECFFGTFLGGCIGYGYSRDICVTDLVNISNAGISKENIYNKKFIGHSLFSQVIIYIVIPLVITSFISAFIIILGYHHHQNPELWTEAVQSRRMLLGGLMNVIVQVTLILIFNKQILSSTNRMTRALESMDHNVNSNISIQTDFQNELSYNQFLANEMLSYLHQILEKTIQIGNEIDNSSNELVRVSSETESTAVEQSTATNEIVATMEDANNLSYNISDKIIEVSNIASETAANVSAGSSLLEQNLNKMAQIASSNEETIKGIKDLNETMNSIWDIITIINSIADTTKIIAFNAELEATNVHEKGRSFKNVANEIRRLANGTMDSTKEIRERINDIQAATDALLKSSQNCTLQIENGINLAKSLEASFESISESATENATSSTEIQTKINQETEAFKQIVVTLHQISRSIENFSASTHTIMDTASNLQKTARELSEVRKITGHDTNLCEHDINSSENSEENI